MLCSSDDQVMAPRRITSVEAQKIAHRLTTVLTSAVLEWLLIFLLFINGIFSYLVTKFAHYCKLQTPCLLCSRLDHVLGNEKLGFYWDLICANHKLEISSLVFCNAHEKLVDVHGMCENCLFSFATKDKSNAETYRLLIRTLGTDHNTGPDQDPLLENSKLDSSTKRHCSCCNEPCISRGYAEKLLHRKSIESKGEKSTMPVTISHMGKKGFDHLAHIGYTEVKITSDTESEVPLSDDDDAHETDAKQNFTQRVDLETRVVTLSDDFASEKLINLTSRSLIEPDESSPLVSSLVVGHGLEELNWHHFELKDDLPSLISINEVASSSNAIDALHEAPEESGHFELMVDPSSPVSIHEVAVPHASTRVDASVEVSKENNALHEAPEESGHFKLMVDPSSPISIHEVAVPHASTRVDASVEASKENIDVLETGELGQMLVTESDKTEISKAGSGTMATTEPNLDVNPSLSDTGLQVPNYLELSDAYKLAIGSRGRQLSDIFSEQRTTKESSRVSEDLKLLLSQIPTTRSLELPLNDISPRVFGLGNSDELKTLEASSSIGMHLLQRRISLERNESGLSVDGSLISEIEGESLQDRFKRQVEHDRRAMSALYKELEEERNASAIATNQAMAMITRLQEEKAALHMEALQYLRMMEEQAEYDMEALQKANDLLAEKEKEVQDLEADLEFYRKKSPGELVLENVVEPVRDLGLEKHSSSDKIDKILLTDNDSSSMKNPLLAFGDERLYILQCLEKLEKKLRLFSNNGVMMETSDNEDREGQKGDLSENGEVHYSRETDLVAIENEVLNLNDRLVCLEADRDFLEHSINSLRNGNEGLRFVQEIAHHLSELRCIAISKTDKAVA